MFWFRTEFSRLVLFLIAKRKYLRRVFPTQVRPYEKSCLHLVSPTMWACFEYVCVKLVRFSYCNMRKRPSSNTSLSHQDEKHLHATSPQNTFRQQLLYPWRDHVRQKMHFIRLMHLIDGSNLSTKPAKRLFEIQSQRVLLAQLWNPLPSHSCISHEPLSAHTQGAWQGEWSANLTLSLQKDQISYVCCKPRLIYPHVEIPHLSLVQITQLGKNTIRQLG